MQDFKNTNIKIDVPCSSNVDGECKKTDTLADCKNLCQAPDCYWGSWSSLTKNCQYVHYPVYKNVNPAFLLKEQPGMTTFMDINFFEYPANRNNRVFYYDRVKIQHIETGYILEPYIRIRMANPYLPTNALEVIPITTSKLVLFYNRDLDSVLRIEGNNVNWFKSVGYMSEDYDGFFIEPVVKRKTPYIFYNDVFHIKSITNQYICLPPMYRVLKPRLNDLVVNFDNYIVPATFRFIYVPQANIFENPS